MTKCTYSGLIGLVLDKKPDEDFISSFKPKDLVKVTKHYFNQANRGATCCYWGLDNLKYARAIDLKDEIPIALKFNRDQNGLFVPSESPCDAGSCKDISKNQAAMKELLSQCLPYVPNKRKGNYFMLTHFEKGCCEFKAGTINLSLEDIKKII